MPGLDCGIDIGSTNLKVLLVGEEGRVRYARSLPSPRVTDGIGPVTDARALIDLLETLIIEGWAQAGGGVPLRSLAVAGVGEDGIGVDGGLTPVGPAIPWFDRRAGDEARSLQERFDCRARTGIAIGPDRTAAKWAWLHKNRPQELAAARWWIALTDYPAVWWSGEPFMSLSLAPRTACFDVVNRQWADDLLRAAHAPELPPLRCAGSIIGGVRRGRLRDSGAASAETIVAAGGHDHPVAAAVIRRLDRRGIVDSLGTANLLYGEARMDDALPQQPHLAFSLPPAGESTVACLGVLELGEALASAHEDAHIFQAFLQSCPLPGSPPGDPAELLTAAPHPHRIRRVLEAECLKARLVLDELKAAGVPDGPIYTSGGWSRSEGFMQLRASIFGRPLRVIADMEVTAMGAALFGAEAAAGKTLCPLGTRDIKHIDPVPGWIGAYKELYAQIRSLNL